MKRKLSIPVKIGIGLCVLQFILSVVLTIKFAGMGFLPDKLLIMLALMLVIMVGITLGLQFVKGLHWAGKVISLVMIVLLIFGLMYVFEGDNTLHKVSDGTSNIEKDSLAVVVLKDSPYEYLNDLAGKKFGVQYQMDVELMGKVVDECKARLENNLEIQAYKNYIELYPALLSGEIDAMVMNSAYLDVMDEFSAEEDGTYFSDQIRVVEYFEFEKTVAEQPTETETEPEHEFDITKDPFIIYVSGIDTYGDIKTKSRSDVNIMLAVNPQNHQILMVTTPRDSFVVIPGVSLAGKDKLTHAGIFGVEKSKETIESIYDLKIRYTVRVNFNSVISIVDALGGVDAYAAYDFQEFHEGMNHLNGEQALRFARERHAFADGDRQRGRDQVEIVRGIINKCTTSTAILTGFNDIMNTVSHQIQTSMPSEDMYALVKNQLEDFRGWDLYAFDTKTTNGREYCYSYPWKSLSVGYIVDSSLEQAKTAIGKIMNGEVLTATDVIQ